DRPIAVFDEVACRLRIASAEVDRQYRLDADEPCPSHELVRGDEVGLDRVPREVTPLRALVARPDAVLPVVTRHEVAARVTDGRHPEPSNQVDDVVAPAIGIRGRVPRLVDAAIDRPAHMLDEGSEEP